MRKALAAAVALIALATCAKEGAITNRSSSKSPDARLIGPPAAQGPPILNFQAAKLGGGQLVGSELAGKDVAVWFWAPW